MFKLALALCVVAAAAVDTEAPIINMDLVTTAMTCTRPASGVADSAAGVTDTIDTCVETCQGTMVGDEACTKPSISAFDHHDGDLTSVIQFKTEFNTAGFNAMQTLGSSSSDDHVFSAIDFAKCGKYTVVLEVSDAAGNAASTNEAKDTLIIKVEDTTPPVITAWTETTTQEASCACGVASDNSDMSVTHALTNGATCTDELAPTNRALEYTITTVELCPRHSDFAAAPTVTGTCHDDGAACLTDDSQPDNVASQTQTFTIEDTIAPVCEIIPPMDQTDDTIIQECGYDYNFCGSTVDNEAQVCEVSCTDAVSQPCGHRNGKDNFDGLTVAKVFTFNKLTVGTGHSVAYTPTDQASNEGLTYTRAIHVVDTQAPVLLVTGGTTECTNTTSCATHKLCHAGTPCAEVVVTCEDHCDRPQLVNPVSAWTTAELNTATAVTGRYIKEYTCTDASSNVESRTVIYDVYPKGIPTLTLISNDPAQNLWEATNTGAYTDSGATAKDSITNDVYTHLIRTSGDIVNLAVEDTYKITYMVTNPHTVCDTCTPQTASEVRTVLVKDNTCPVASDANPSTQTIEAGFPYVDSPITFSDSMDGVDIGTVTTGDGIVGGAMFQGQDDTGSGNTDGHCPASTSSEATRKVIGGVDCICFKGNTFVPNPATDSLTDLPDFSASCTAAGLLIPTADEIQALKSAAYSQFHARTHEDVTTDAAVTHGDTHIMFPCKVVSDAGSHLVFLKDTTDEVTHTEGTYHITYSATDAANNGASCTHPVRTIIVEDTLPPVITLQDGDIKAKGADESNPAWHYNPFSLMAEQTSVNGWMVGAVASFVAGVALVSFSSKSESYSVPV